MPYCGLQVGLSRDGGQTGCSEGVLLFKGVVELGLQASHLKAPRGHPLHTSIFHPPAVPAWRPGATAGVLGWGSWLLLWLCWYQSNPCGVFPGGWCPLLQSIGHSHRRPNCENKITVDEFSVYDDPTSLTAIFLQVTAQALIPSEAPEAHRLDKNLH